MWNSSSVRKAAPLALAAFLAMFASAEAAPTRGGKMIFGRYIESSVTAPAPAAASAAAETREENGRRTRPAPQQQPT